MEKYISFKILSVTAKRMIFSWFLWEPNELFKNIISADYS